MNRKQKESSNNKDSSWEGNNDHWGPVIEARFRNKTELGVEASWVTGI